MVHALITAGIYSAYESDAFCSGAVPSISRPRSNFNCLVIRLDSYPDHVDTFRHYFSMYYRNIFLLSIHVFNREGGIFEGSREVRESDEWITPCNSRSQLRFVSSAACAFVIRCAFICLNYVGSLRKSFNWRALRKKQSPSWKVECHGQIHRRRCLLSPRAPARCTPARIRRRYTGV